MKEKITPYLRNLSAAPAIQQQYSAATAEPANHSYNDPLMEDSYEVVKGLIHKYPNRALIKVSYQCAAHCRFCTRIRQIGDPAGTLTTTDIDAIARYLSAHPQVDDVILSGGDPLYMPAVTAQLLATIRNIPSVKVIRIGTRLPVQLPAALAGKATLTLLQLIKEIAAGQPFYILIHINHPDELTTEAIAAIRTLRGLGVTLLSQSVFLKNINDSFEVLYELYTRLHHIGVMPYYLYHCDAVDGIQHFSVDIEKEKDIATQLTASLSGIACPTYVIDIEEGHGKIPVPLNFFDAGQLTDFNGKCHDLK